MHSSFNRLTWTLLAVTALLLGGAAVRPLRPAAQQPEPRVVEVTARRFAFEPAVIDAVVGERLRLAVRSGDGVHGIEIKRFKVKKEIPRGGAAVTIDFTASEEGTFPILCSEYCGDGHDDMTGTLVVRSVPRPDPSRGVRLQRDPSRGARLSASATAPARPRQSALRDGGQPDQNDTHR